MSGNGKKQHYTDQFERCAFTLEEVRQCLDHEDPNGMSWREYCERNGWDTEDMLMPLALQHARAKPN